MFGISTPLQFYQKLVQEFDDFCEAPSSARHAVNFVITAHHMSDWVWVGFLNKDRAKKKQLGLDDNTLRNLEVAALLHDIGKVGIPDAILRKPSKLNADEYALIKKHPDYGWAVLRMLPGFESAALDILHHHESVDGSGYPAGLRNSEIPIVSRIVCVIDAYDAMVSSRPYRKGLPFKEAARRLIASSGKQFDAAVVRSFLPIARAETSTVFAAAGTAVDSAL